ncbi:hypothetical protein GCM10018775_15200 [Streptomyces umbrinus]|nr:hypothetical protein GCM10018775_15200 [Streptomyces umbrinus]
MPGIARDQPRHPDNDPDHPDDCLQHARNCDGVREGQSSTTGESDRSGGRVVRGGAGNA